MASRFLHRKVRNQEVVILPHSRMYIRKEPLWLLKKKLSYKLLLVQVCWKSSNP